MAASSPMHRQTANPTTETMMMAGMAAAPMACTANGTMPVTRMIPASPMTNAPHQLVPRWREVATSGVAPVVSVLMWLLLAGSGGSEQAQVVVDLPRRHHRVVATELGTLDIDEVVDVVTVGGFSQSIAEDRVTIEPIERLRQGGGQHREPQLGGLLGGDAEEVHGGGLARVDSPVDTVQTGSDLRAEGDVRVGRPVDAPVLHPIGFRDPEHHRPVVAAVGGIGG